MKTNDRWLHFYENEMESSTLESKKLIKSGPADMIFLPISGIYSVLFLIFRLDYGLTNTDRLYEYISARMYGEHTGDCETAYPQCPFSAFNLLNPEEIMNVLGNTI